MKNNDAVKKEIAQRLTTARAAGGYSTAKEFAQKNGIPQPTYAMHEKGTRGLKQDTAIKYAEILGVRTAWLLTGEDPMSLASKSASALAAKAAEIMSKMDEASQRAALRLLQALADEETDKTK